MIKILNKKVFNPFWINYILRNLSTNTVPEELNQKNIKKPRAKKIKEPTVSKDIREYFINSGQSYVINKIPHKLLSKKIKTPDFFHLFNEQTASTISKNIFKNFNYNEMKFIEVNPGLGYLTKFLLNNYELKHLILYETYDSFAKELQEIQNEYKFILKKGDFVGLWKMVYMDKLDNGNRVNNFLEDVPKSSWTDDSKVTLFASVGSVHFFSFLISTLVFQTGIFAYGRPEFYFVVPPLLYMHLACSNKLGYAMYRGTTVLFQLLFEHEFITRLPREHFLPRQFNLTASRNMKMKELACYDFEHMYLIKVVPRRNLFEYCTLENLPILWYFIKQNLISRKNRVIPSIERWVLNSGPRLILDNTKTSVIPKPLKIISNMDDLPINTIITEELTTENYFNNLNIFTEFGDLTPSQLLTLFNTFVNWPEFQECSFRASLENNILKMETAEQGEQESLSLDDTDHSNKSEKF